MTSTATVHEDKTGFVRDVLTKNPRANTTFVNEAWKDAGRDGQISATLVNKLRSLMGLTGNLRSTTKNSAASAPATSERGGYTGKKRGRKPKQTETETETETETVTGTVGLYYVNGLKTQDSMEESSSDDGFDDNYQVFEELEADFDRLLFKVMGLGGLTAIEDSLRQTRRLLYGGFSSKR